MGKYNTCVRVISHVNTNFLAACFISDILFNVQFKVFFLKNDFVYGIITHFKYKHKKIFMKGVHV